MRSPGAIENVKKKIHVKARKMLYDGIGDFVWAKGSGGGKVRGSRKKFSGGERKAEGRVRLLRARGSAELIEVAPGSGTQGLWMRNGKVRSRIIDVDRSRFPGRGTVGEVRRGGRGGRKRTSDRTKERGHRFRVTFGQERKASRLHASALVLATTDDECREAEM